ARDARSDYRDLRARGVRVVSRADDPRVEPLDRRRLPLIESLPLRHPLEDVDQHYLTRQLLQRESLCSGRADVAGSDHRDLIYHVPNLMHVKPAGAGNRQAQSRKAPSRGQTRSRRESAGGSGVEEGGGRRDGSRRTSTQPPTWERARSPPEPVSLPCTSQWRSGLMRSVCSM